MAMAAVLPLFACAGMTAHAGGGSGYLVSGAMQLPFNLGDFFKRAGEVADRRGGGVAKGEAKAVKRLWKAAE